MKERKIKCVVWDLDGTVWDGILLEDPEVKLREHVVDVIRTLDARGILHSIASRNDHATAWAKLESLGLAEYFLHPRIHWASKSESVRAIAADLNIGLDTIAFIDDQPFELDEVAFACPEVLCLSAQAVPELAARPDMTPRFVTDDARNRRHMMRSDIQRQAEEESYAGPQEAFLATLGLELRLSPAQEEDLRRAEELTLRTNQLNTTGDTYGYDALRELAASPEHLLLMAELTDKYGSYGKIGLMLVDKQIPDVWLIKLLLMSCRVMSRGIGGILINHLRNLARQAGASLLAEFVPTERNRMMYVTYKFNHFREVGGTPQRLLLENDLSVVQSHPDYVRLLIADSHVQPLSHA
jgi:FkbH-like protein